MNGLLEPLRSLSRNAVAITPLATDRFAEPDFVGYQHSFLRALKEPVVDGLDRGLLEIFQAREHGLDRLLEAVIVHWSHPFQCRTGISGRKTSQKSRKSGGISGLPVAPCSPLDDAVYLSELAGFAGGGNDQTLKDWQMCMPGEHVLFIASTALFFAGGSSTSPLDSSSARRNCKYSKNCSRLETML